MSGQPNRVIAAAEAARIWKRFGFQSPQEMVIEDLAMALGIVVMDGPLDSAAARLVRSGDNGLARISDAIKDPARRKFAIAHEIGHWQLHKKKTHLLACTNEDMLASYRSSPLEVEASIFAAALLMPEELFVAETKNNRPNAATIKRLSTHFGCSLTATALRYVETSEDYCVFIISEKGKIRWWRASRSFGDHDLWIENKSAVPSDSSTSAIFRGQPRPDRPQRRSLHDWLGNLPEIDGDTVIEETIPLLEYGQVLTLLWLP
jgi:hypothetical protein